MRILDRRNLISWRDPWLLAICVIGAAVRLGRLGDYDNPYYTAAVASMLESAHNFFFAAFDPAGTVTVDKPPAAFWLQAAPAAIFGVKTWSVTLPQVIMGMVSIPVIYWLVGSVYGRVSGVTAAMLMGVLPASVVIDSRNEPDALVVFALLLGSVAIFKAVRTWNFRWNLLFALLMGVAFNAKMFVAFVPLPAFILFYLIAANRPMTQVLLRAILTVCMMLFVSFAWIGIVAVTPADERPYVGSTQDNSIWTLVFEYNGLDRFTSFIGPRRPHVPAPSLNRAGSPPAALDVHRDYPPIGPPITVDGVDDEGVMGLLKNPLANQLGWLLPVGLVTLVMALIPVFPDEVYRKPGRLIKNLRVNSRAAFGVMWAGWLLTGLLIFGTANATTTHPYYLVGLVIPLAAVIGIGAPAIWKTFNMDNRMGWVVVVFFVLVASYQVYGSRTYVGDWVVNIVLLMVLLSGTLMMIGVMKRLQAEPMGGFAACLGGISLMIIPLITAINTGQRIAGPPAVLPHQAGPGMQQRQPLADGSLFDHKASIIEFLEAENRKGQVVTLLTVNAREAAPFIVAGFRAMAIGGFSGNDPIFDVKSFQSKVERDGPKYFLLPGQGPMGRMSRAGTQEAIIAHVRVSWSDWSHQAGLPLGTLYARTSTLR